MNLWSHQLDIQNASLQEVAWIILLDSYVWIHIQRRHNVITMPI